MFAMTYTVECTSLRLLFAPHPTPPLSLSHIAAPHMPIVPLGGVMQVVDKKCSRGSFASPPVSHPCRPAETAGSSKNHSELKKGVVLWCHVEANHGTMVPVRGMRA